MSFMLVLVLMASYYILRPVRDAMASNWSDAEVSWLWTFTFLFSLIVVSLYGLVVSRLRFSLLVPSVYGFFSLSFILFYFSSQSVSNRDLIDKAFYVWTSVFSLFHISVFWSFMADLFSRLQAIRLFGFIGAGASVGGILGPGLTTLLARDIGSDALVLIASILLLLTIPVIGLLQRFRKSGLPDAMSEAVTGSIGGNPFAGYTEFIRSPFLIGIGVFILFYTSISSFVYFEMKNLLEPVDRDTRTAIWSVIDLVVNCLTVIIAVFATGRIARRLGLPFTLASIPVIIMAGLIILAAAPMISVVVGIQIVRRVGNYAITRPAREMLYTAVGRETRFKAKSVLDIVVYRGGDMLNAWAFTALTQGLGLGMAAVAVVGAGIALVWASVGVYLGRRFNELKNGGDDGQEV